MNCVRKSYLRHLLYIRTLIWLCSSQGLLHWHYLKDAATATAASFTCTHTSSAIHPNNSRRKRENPFTPRKRYLMCKITTRRGLGSGGAAKSPIPPPARLGRAVPNSLEQGSGRWHPAFRRQVASVHALPTLPPAWRQRLQPRYLILEGSCRSSNYLCNQLITSLPAPFMVFYCPAGTTNRKWSGNIWNTRYDAASGKLPTHPLEFPIHL